MTTTYSIKPHKQGKKKAAAPAAAGEDGGAAAATAGAPRGALVLKTYDPHTGTTLKYRTTKAAEVSRLILSLGKLSRPMAGLPALRDEAVADVEGGSGAGTPAVADEGPAPAAAAAAAAPAAPAATPAAGGGGGGGKGKKKKGKK